MPLESPLFAIDREMTIAEFIATTGATIERGMMLSRNGDVDYILRADWDTEIIRDQDCLVFVPLPLMGGGGGGGSQVLQIVMMLVIAVLAVITGGAAAAAYGAWAAGAGASAVAASAAATSVVGTAINMTVAASIMIAGSMVMSAIFAPDQVDSNAGSTNYGASNQQNIAKLGGCIPVLYGRFKFYPDLLVQPYVEVIGEETWLYMFMCLTQGECTIEEIFIEDTPLSRFERGSYDYRVYGPNESPTLFPVSMVYCGSILNIQLRGQTLSCVEAYAARRDPSDNLDLSVPTKNLHEPWVGPYILTPRGTGVNSVVLDLQFPQGLYRTENTGKERARGAGLCVQLREVGYTGDDFRSWSCMIDPTFYDVDGYFTNGPIVIPHRQENTDPIGYFYVFFDHHPGFLTRKVAKNHMVGSAGVDNLDDVFNDFGKEQSQTINLHGLVADESGRINGVPITLLEDVDLPVVEMNPVMYGGKQYWRATIPMPVKASTVQVWSAGIDYVIGDYAGHTEKDPYVDDKVWAYRCTRAHTSADANKPPPWGISTNMTIGIDILALWDVDIPAPWDSPRQYFAGDYVIWPVDGVGDPIPGSTKVYIATDATNALGIPEQEPGVDPIWNDDLLWEVINPNGDLGYYGRGLLAPFEGIPGESMVGIYWGQIVGGVLFDTYFFDDSWSTGASTVPEREGVVDIAGYGGTNVSYSKWYNYGAARDLDWAMTNRTAMDKIDITSSVFEGWARGESNYDAYNRASGFRLWSTAVDADRTETHRDLVMYNPLPQSNIFVYEKKPSPFNRTIKKSIANITEELSTLDAYGAKNADQSTPVKSNREFGRFEIRARQMGLEGFEDGSHHNSVVLQGVRCSIPERRSYGNITTLAIKLKANYAFNSATKNKLNVIAIRKLPVWRQSGAVDLLDNGIYTRNEYGVGAVEIEFDTVAGAAQYAITDIVDIAGVVESGVSKMFVAGFPAAMITGEHKLLRKLGSKSYLIMLDKVVRIRSDEDPLSGSILAVTAPVWADATDYDIGSIVSSSSVTYRSLSSHTSELGVNDPPGAQWEVVAGTALQLDTPALTLGNDSNDNLAGLAIRIRRGGERLTEIVSGARIKVKVEDGSPTVRVHWLAHGFSVGDDFEFAHVPETVHTITGVSDDIWRKTRKEDTNRTDLCRTAHVVTSVIDVDNFEFKLVEVGGVSHDGKQYGVPVRLRNAPPAIVTRVEYELTGTGYPSAQIKTLGTWSSLTIYAAGDLAWYDGVVYVALITTAGDIPSSSALDWEATDQAYATNAHRVSDAYVGGRLYLDPLWFRPYPRKAAEFQIGEWCKHQREGGVVRYYSRIGAGVVSVGANGVFTANQEPGYPASAYWVERNRATTGAPTWFFDIVGIDTASNAYVIQPEDLSFTEKYGSAGTMKLGVGCVVKPNPVLEVGSRGADRFTVARFTEYEITHNDAATIVFAGADEAEEGAHIDIVLSAAATADDTQATSQENILIDTHEAGGWTTELVETQSPAWAFADMLRNTEYGCGVDDDYIGLTDIAELDKLCSGSGDYANTDRDSGDPPEWVVDHAYERLDRVMVVVNGSKRLFYCALAHDSTAENNPLEVGGQAYWKYASQGVPDTFNGIFDKQGTAWTSLSAVTGVCRSSPTIIHGVVVSVVRDDYKVIPRQMFTDRNMIQGTLSVTYLPFTDDENDSLSLRFINEKTWAADEVLAFPADPTDPEFYSSGYLEGNTLLSYAPAWDVAATYRRNEFVRDGGSTYKSTEDDNVGNDPSGGTVGWVKVDGVFVGTNEMDNVIWEDGTEMTIMSFVSQDEVIVSIFDQKASRGAPGGFTILHGTHSNPAVIEAFGFTSRKQAWREARSRVDATRNRRAMIRFSTEYEGLIARYGDRIIVSGLWGQAGDIVEVTTGEDGFTYLTLDRELAFKDTGAMAYDMPDNPIRLGAGGRSVYVSTSDRHRVQPGSVITMTGLSGSSGNFTSNDLNNVPQVVQTVEDEYTFTIMSEVILTSDATEVGGLGGSFSIDYESDVLNAVIRKVDGSAVGPMAIAFYELPGDPNYFLHLRVDTADLEGFVPVVDTDQEKSHYLIGMSESFRRDCKVISVTPRDKAVDIVAYDDGDNSHYESDLTLKYVSDIDQDVIPQSYIAPYFENIFDADSVPQPVITATVTGTTDTPLVRLQWQPAKGAVMYVVQQSHVSGRNHAWYEVDRITGTVCELTVEPGEIETWRITPVGWGYGTPAYFSGVVRLDGNFRSMISLPGQIIKSGRNTDIEPLDDTDTSTILALMNKREQSLSGPRNGFNKHFSLAADPIRPDLVQVEMGNPKQLLKPVKVYTKIGVVGFLGGVAGLQEFGLERPLEGKGGSMKMFKGIFVGDYVMFSGSDGIRVYADIAADEEYNAGTTYSIGDYVMVGGYAGPKYHCLQTALGKDPATETAYWGPLVNGDLVVSGEALIRGGRLWTAGETYVLNDRVVDAYGNTFKAKNASHTATIENSPPLDTEWTEIPHGWPVSRLSLGAMPNTYNPATTYTVGQVVKVSTGTDRWAFYECVRGGTGNDPLEVRITGLWWKLLAPEEWPDQYGYDIIYIDLTGVEYEPGFSHLYNTTTRPISGVANSAQRLLPRNAFMTAPGQDRIFVFDPGHGLAKGFCTTQMTFTVSDDEYAAMTTTCGIWKEYIFTAESDEVTNPNFHQIYVIDASAYYFLPKKLDGTRLTDALVPTSMMVAGSPTVTRTKRPTLMLHAPIGVDEFVVMNDNEIVLGAAPFHLNEVSAFYAARE